MLLKLDASLLTQSSPAAALLTHLFQPWLRQVARTCGEQTLEHFQLPILFEVVKDTAQTCSTVDYASSPFELLLCINGGRSPAYWAVCRGHCQQRAVRHGAFAATIIILRLGSSFVTEAECTAV